ncbi:unnamed protein product [Cuscuta epithymum]|uniref:Retrotransposon gag domain-containing protein n=1 Tax=Cuscuta epithymum TaxID=186058 RepID=A0AAV0CDA9_9ASTE|nr:unnamed protein product [Cuscuta epithymum]
MTWEEFTQAPVARFEWLSEVKQMGTIDEYNTLLVQLTSQVPRLFDDYYLGYYMNELKGPMRGSLRLDNLETAMELARDIEDTLSCQNEGEVNLIIQNAFEHYCRPRMGLYVSSKGNNMRGSTDSFSKATGQATRPTSGQSGQSTACSRFS